MKKLFGTDGIRGIANKNLTPELAFRLGRVIGYIMTKNNKKTFIVIGKDTRISGDMIESALTSGICSSGMDVYHLGILPTPGISYLTKYLKAQAGIVISASHNPVEDNGIKFFNKSGFKLSDEIEKEIEMYIYKKEDNLPRPTFGKIGKIINFKQGRKIYKNYLQNICNINLNGIKVVLDNANGASFKIMPKILKNLKAEVISIFDKPNGININKNCGSTNLENLRKKVIKTKSDLGIAHDGDADRVIAIDELGKVVNGDQIMAICAKYLKENKLLKNNLLIGTIMSNLGLHKFCDKEKIKFITTQVGDRYVLEEMIKKNSIIGGEQSGHIIFKKYNTTGDGMLTALILLKIMKEKKEKLSVLANQMNIYPQILKNVKVKDKKKSLKDEKFIKSIEKINELFKKKCGRILVRPSGTESIIRIMAEGENKKEIENIVNKLANIIKE